MASRPPEQVMVHLYRGELNRSDRWRTRLDTSTNWALTSAAAVISVTFSTPRSSHLIVLAGVFLVGTFLALEARRYRYYDLWIRRVRLMEEGFMGPTLRDEAPDADALRELAELIHRPRLYVSFIDAIGLRFRRTYAPIFTVLLVSWSFKLMESPTPARSFGEVVSRAAVGRIPGAIVMAFVTTLVLAMAALLVRSFMRPLPLGELRARRLPRRPVAAIFSRANR